MLLNLPDCSIAFTDCLLEDHQAIYAELINTIQWRQDSIKLYGKLIPQPRLTAWYGDESYTYSGITMNPLPWNATLLEIKNKVENACNVEFNSVLLNLYRDGNDSVSWHSDDEKGLESTIASVSLGATRKFQLKHKTNKELKECVELTSGSLLVMSGETQKNWLHQVPKTKKFVEPRINLTFRVIK